MFFNTDKKKIKEMYDILTMKDFSPRVDIKPKGAVVYSGRGTGYAAALASKEFDFDFIVCTGDSSYSHSSIETFNFTPERTRQSLVDHGVPLENIYAVKQTNRRSNIVFRSSKSAFDIILREGLDYNEGLKVVSKDIHLRKASLVLTRVAQTKGRKLIVSPVNNLVDRNFDDLQFQMEVVRNYQNFSYYVERILRRRLPEDRIELLKKSRQIEKRLEDKLHGEEITFNFPRRIPYTWGER